MKTKLAAMIAVALFAAAALGSAQSLEELAKKEKERREKLKGESKVITDKDTARYARGAVSTASPHPSAPRENPAGEKLEAPGISGGHIEWSSSISWNSWEEGISIARLHNKPILLLVYANWCPRSHELVPALRDGEVVALSENFVMIRQDSDEKPAWLKENFGRFGGYVPRIFFLKPDGTVRPEIASAHPRYPYFYFPEDLDALKKSMRKAASD